MVFSPPIPQIPSTAIASIPTINPLEYTEDELVIVKKWQALYNNEADKIERYNLLRGKILPRLYLLNKELPANAWKERKSVSTVNKFYCYF
jgi:hypothetical protein